MLKIAKAEKIENYDVQLHVDHVTSHSGGSVKECNFLAVDIVNDNYSLGFIIAKDINELLNIKKYEKMDLARGNLYECYVTTKEKEYVDMKIYDMEINMYGDAIGISFVFNCNQDYYGLVDIEIELDKLKELATEE